mmetsp:Transcript_9582/g.14365  ORF Transcript_9582/g.14365 Transcript_9582/m.14365 type:complete len:254 (-) Transcript_9582:25-786(-)
MTTFNAGNLNTHKLSSIHRTGNKAKSSRNPSLPIAFIRNLFPPLRSGFGGGASIVALVSGSTQNSLNFILQSRGPAEVTLPALHNQYCNGRISLVTRTFDCIVSSSIAYSTSNLVPRSICDAKLRWGAYTTRQLPFQSKSDIVLSTAFEGLLSWRSVLIAFATVLSESAILLPSLKFLINSLAEVISSTFADADDRSGVGVARVRVGDANFEEVIRADDLTPLRNDRLASILPQTPFKASNTINDDVIMSGID